MNFLKGLKIGSWLLIGFTIILSFSALLGYTSYTQTKNLYQQTETMYNHPLTVRRSLDNLKLSLSESRASFRDLMLLEDQVDKEAALLSMELLLLDIESEFQILEEKYLGPEEDVVEAYQAFVVWSSVRESNIELVESGQVAVVLDSISESGEEGMKRDDLLEKIDVIDVYAQNKADELFLNSQSLSDQMQTQLAIIVTSLFLFTLTIGFWLYRSFQTPLSLMNNTVLDFQSGKMDSRIDYSTKNELGTLAKSINEMASVIESSNHLHEQVSDFSEKIIFESNSKQFFMTVLKTLMEQTKSIAAAVYLYNDKTGIFSVFESIGLQTSLLKNYKKSEFEGDFGVLLNTREISITRIPDHNESYVYNAITIGVLPKEILSIPLVNNREIFGVINLASTTEFSEIQIEFINRIYDNLSSRSSSVLASNRINDFVLELEQRSDELIAQNAELEVQKKQLNEASKLKSNFLSNMSHELRTPLNSVIALSGVLYDRLPDKISAEEYSYLEIIGRNGKNLLHLINDILDISRIESGKVEMDVKKFKVVDLIKDIFSMFEIQAKDKGINFNYHVFSDDLLISSDYDKCKHIIQNLVSNAIKFTEFGSVDVEIVSVNSHLQINVIDTGIGIATENLLSIFEEFKQADSGTSRRFGGTGLGLSIAKKYTSMLNGTLNVKSDLGIGTTFTLTLPRVFKVKDNPILKQKVPTVSKNKIKQQFEVNNSADTFDKIVLLIEDNESVIIQMKELVKGMGVGILVAESGEEGLDVLKTKEVDAIVLDLMMPGIDGFEVLKQVRNHDETAHLPVLVLTAKHLTKNDLSLLKRNNVHQLVQKGDINRIDLQTSIFNMLFNTKHIKVSRKIARLKQPKVLIVEDNKDNIITLKAILRDFGELEVAEDGELGIKKAKDFVPDVILMDIALPKVNGIEAFHEIRGTKDLEHIPIIAITASALEEEKERILSHGFDGFIPKPIIAETFLQTLEKVMYDE